MMNKLRQARNTDVRLKLKIREFVEGKMITIVMSLVTVFALVGDDIRVFGFNK